MITWWLYCQHLFLRLWSHSDCIVSICVYAYDYSFFSVCICGHTYDNIYRHISVSFGAPQSFQCRFNCPSSFIILSKKQIGLRQNQSIIHNVS